MAARHTSYGSFPDCNEKALKLKQLIPNAVAFAGLDHGEDFVKQAKRYLSQGFDGIKLLEGKPSEYRYYGYGYEHPRFDAFFAYAEEEKIPLLIHNNDPLINWDISRAPKRAIQMGWVYDESLPSQEWFFQAMEAVLKKHPKLCVALAHMGFYADDLDRAERLMEACPNLRLDITPALCIFSQLSQTPERSEAFFRKYHERLIYGTDAHNHLVGEARAYNDLKTEVMTAFLEGDAPRKIGDLDIVPIRLEPYMLENIYYNNAMRFINRSL